MLFGDLVIAVEFIVVLDVSLGGVGGVGLVADGWEAASAICDCISYCVNVQMFC